jgi:hypothetical protein
MSYAMQWPAGTSPEWLLEKIQRMELLVIRARREGEQAMLYGSLTDLEASSALGMELDDLTVKLAGPGHVCVFMLAMMHSMLSQETIDLERMCRTLRFPDTQRTSPMKAQSMSALDLFLDNAERESE